jgi:hypothetical protein
MIDGGTFGNVLGDEESLDEHDPTGGDNGQEGDDVHYADRIEYDKAWASQRSLEERHIAGEGRSTVEEVAGIKDLEEGNYQYQATG